MRVFPLTLGVAMGAMLAAGAALAQNSGDAPELAGERLKPFEPLAGEAFLTTQFSADRLDVLGITDTHGLMGQVPNLTGATVPGIGSANGFYLRGLGSSETLATSDTPVGSFIDGVRVSPLVGNNLALLFDVDRVDVLRGPQGVLLGRNTMGGAVSLVLKRPAETFGGFVEGGYGSYDRLRVRGSVDLPLGEMLQVKLSAYAEDDDGYARNTTTDERVNDQDRAGVRIAAQLKLVERLRWNVALAYMEDNGENLLTYRCDPYDPARCGGHYLSTGMISALRTGGGGQYTLPVSGDKAGFGLGNAVATTLLTSDIEWAGDAVRLNLISGFLDLSQASALDFADGRAVPDVGNPVPIVRGFVNGGAAVLTDGSQRRFSQEVRLSGGLGSGLVDYVVGGLIEDEDNRTDVADMLTAENGTVTGAPLLLADRVISNSTTAWSGYADANVHVMPTLTLTAGVRYTDEKKRFSVRDNRGGCGADPAPVGCLNDAIIAPNGAVVPLSQHSKGWTPRAGVSFRPTERLTFFATAAKGTHSGGWNGRAVQRDMLLPYDQESAWSYEAGVKSLWLDGRVHLNLTGFFLDVDDFQAPSSLAGPLGLGAVPQNGTGYRNKGLELELAAAPIDGLNLSFNLGFQDDDYRVSDSLLPNRYGVKAVHQQQLDCRAQLAAGRIPLAPAAQNAPDCATGIVTASGDIAEPVFTPDFTLAFGGSYEWPIPKAGVIVVPAANFLYRSRMETGAANATIFGGPSPAAFDGTVFPTNAFAGNLLGGSRAAPFWQVNVSLAMRTDDGNWMLALQCENCLDKAETEASYLNQSYLTPPVTWMLKARRRF